MATEHVCAACPKSLGRSCCEVEGDLTLVSLTSADIARVQAATGRPATEFVVEERVSTLAKREFERMRPAHVGIVRDGVRRHLRAEGRACVFHRADRGCTLSASARPLACRLYPFAVDWAGDLGLQPVGRCLAIERHASLDTLADELGTSRHELHDLHRQLIEELRADRT